MTKEDVNKLKFLRETFDRNYELTHLYKLYLERFPDFISKEDILEMTKDGVIDKKEAIVAFLAAAFNLDSECGRDRRMIDRYLRNSVRILNAEDYYNDSYAKNIKIPLIKKGRWEFKKEIYPAYRGVIADDLIIKPDFTEIPPLGFFEEDFSFYAVLEDGNEWMTLTPVDMDSCKEAISEAHGDVITFGLGLGYYCFKVSEKENVRSVTVVEKSRDVIDLFSEYILPQIKNRDKIKIVHDDAILYAQNTMPELHFDYAFVDTYRDAHDGAPMYTEMKNAEKLNKNVKFSYWIKNFIVSRLRAEKFEEIYGMYERNEENAPKSYEEILRILRDIEHGKD